MVVVVVVAVVVVMPVQLCFAPCRDTCVALGDNIMGVRRSPVHRITWQTSWIATSIHETGHARSR